MLAGAGQASAMQPAVVETPSARISGQRVATRNAPVAQFTGIRYARAQRWQAPVLETPAGEVDAGATASICPQQQGNPDWYKRVAAAFGHPGSVVPPRPPIDEDCLFLNVWSPDPQTRKPLPVMVWIHGGSNKNGYSFEPNYLGHELASEGVVVVSIAYRLGVFGFLAHPEFEVPGSGNFGLLDQITALQWIAANIHHFGGDAGNVTLFGESAGAADIGYLMASPMADGLFQRAISQSGGWSAQRETTLASQAVAGHTFARSALSAASGTAAEQHAAESKDAENGENTEAPAALRRMPVEQLLELAASHFKGHYWDPVIDGAVLRSSIPQLLKQGEFRHLPLLIGFNSDEGLMYQPA